MTRAELHTLVDHLPDRAVGGAAVLLYGLIDGSVDPDRAWFWNTWVAAKGARGGVDKAAGNVDRYGGCEEFLTARDDRCGTSVPTGRWLIWCPGAPYSGGVFTHASDNSEARDLELPVEELLRRARPLPPHDEMAIEDLTDEEGAAFLDAVDS